MPEPLLSPADGAALVAARLHAADGADLAARNFWLIVSDARRAFREGRAPAAYRGLGAIRYRLARARFLGDAAWIARLKAAEADLETRARAALDPTA